MKDYEKPVVEIIDFETETIMGGSGGTGELGGSAGVDLD